MPRQLTKRQLSILRRRVYSANYRAQHDYDQPGRLDLEGLVSWFETGVDVNCAYCNKKLTPSTVSLDHTIPFAEGGTNTWENISLACRKCNRYKRAISAVMFRGFLAHLANGGFLQLFFANYRPQSYRR